MLEPVKSAKIHRIREEINEEKRIAELRGLMGQPDNYEASDDIANANRVYDPIDLHNPRPWDKHTMGWCRICGKKYADIQPHLRKKYGIREKYLWYYYNENAMEDLAKYAEIQKIFAMKNRGEINVEQRLAELRDEMEQSIELENAIEQDKPRVRNTIGWCRICGIKDTHIQRHLRTEYGILENYPLYYYKKDKMEDPKKFAEIQRIAAM